MAGPREQPRKAKGFLGRVDAFAKKHSLKRAEMITRGLRLAMGEPKA